jgi:hypothetical protein
MTGTKNQGRRMYFHYDKVDIVAFIIIIIHGVFSIFMCVPFFVTLLQSIVLLMLVFGRSHPVDSSKEDDP